jgi:hypothetical protein
MLPQAGLVSFPIGTETSFLQPHNVLLHFMMGVDYPPVGTQANK